MIMLLQFFVGVHDATAYAFTYWLLPGSALLLSLLLLSLVVGQRTLLYRPHVPGREHDQTPSKFGIDFNSLARRGPQTLTRTHLGGHATLLQARC
jgi:hypothetical protein